MIVKIHSRGAGSGSGPVDYLLGKARDREKAVVLRGEPERVRQLIDGCEFARAYTSGVLSFREGVSLEIGNFCTLSTLFNQLGYVSD